MRKHNTTYTKQNAIHLGSFGPAFCGLVCHISTFRFVYCVFGFGLQLVLNEIFFFFLIVVLTILCFLISFSHVMSVKLSSYWLWWNWNSHSLMSCLDNNFTCLELYIYNILTISLGTLCFMHLVSGRNLNIFSTKFFFLTGRVMGYLSQVGSWVNQFLFQVKKSSSS